MSDIATAKRGKKDSFANVAFGVVTQSAANTMTFAQIQVAVGLFQGVAVLLHRVLWYPDAALIREIVAATDSFYFALTVSNRVAAINDATDPSIIAMKWLIGIAANIEQQELPYVSDFSSLPMGGRLIPANPLFVACHSAGAAAARTLRVQLDFTFVTLADADYLELLQSMYPVSV